MKPLGYCLYGRGSMADEGVIVEALPEESNRGTIGVHYHILQTEAVQTSGRWFALR